MRYFCSLVTVSLCLTLLIGCAQSGVYGTTDKGLIKKEGGQVYLYGNNGTRKFLLETSNDFSLPMNQCAEIRGSANYNTNELPVFNVTDFRTFPCDHSGP